MTSPLLVHFIHLGKECIKVKSITFLKLFEFLTFSDILTKDQSCDNAVEESVYLLYELLCTVPFKGVQKHQSAD